MPVVQEAFLAQVNLTAQDRCDYCGAQAWIVASRHALRLDFCVHHGREHMVVLMAQGWTIQDDSARLEAEEAPAHV